MIVKQIEVPLACSLMKWGSWRCVSVFVVLFKRFKPCSKNGIVKINLVLRMPSFWIQDAVVCITHFLQNLFKWRLKTIASIYECISLLLPIDFQFGFGPELVGLIFLCMSGVYTFTAPFWGYLSDRFVSTSFTISRSRCSAENCKMHKCFQMWVTCSWR